MPLQKDWREFIECFNRNEVDYVLVGALAVAWHGYSRNTGDIDFLVRSSPENAAKIVAALAEFGFSAVGLRAKDFESEDRIVQLGYEPNRIDVITKISGVEFEEAWAGKVAGEIDGIPVNILGLDELLRNKATTGRGKDRIDLDELKAMHGRD